jgi:hypothetical protein
MGEVWKARDTRLELTVAIEVSKQESSEREARAVAALNHPHITLHNCRSRWASRRGGARAQEGQKLAKEEDHRFTRGFIIPTDW